MTETNTVDLELRARRETRGLCFMLLMSLVVVYLASRGTFRSMMLFPHVFGAIISIFALVSLLIARPAAWRIRVPLTLAIIGLAIVAPTIHMRGFRAYLERREAVGMEALAGMQAPAVTYTHSFNNAETGGTVQFGNGRVTLVNFWATWCPPCVAEMPLLQAAWKRQGEEGLDIVGVTRFYDGPDDRETEIEEIRDFLRERDVSYTILIEQGSRAHSDYLAVSLPSSILVDQNGEVVDYGAGIAGTERLLDRARQLLESGP